MTGAVKNKIRLFVEGSLKPQEELLFSETASHYLCTVMRVQAGEVISCFNGRDGEFDVEIVHSHKKQAAGRVLLQTKLLQTPPDLCLLFAPLKKDQTDFVVEKATELGATRLLPVLTARTNSDKVRTERLQAQAIEAAEQCRRIDVPEVSEAVKLEKILAAWEEERILYLMDETGKGRPAAEAFAAHAGKPAAILIGPEGGFAPEEIEQIYKLPFVQGVSLGPRILRAETAAAAALAVWQATAGDWKEKE